MNNLIIRQFALNDYGLAYKQMAELTNQRDKNTPDEFWGLQHQPVFTLGLAGQQEHILDAGNIPVVKTDRGGQVTYHGPGQLIVYVMLDLKRQDITIKRLIHQLEQSVINLCHKLNIDAVRKQGAPGVYVADNKLAALGIRVRRGCSYHGLALNVDMDLEPFLQINPCGYPGMKVTQLSNFRCVMNVNQTFESLLPHLMKQLNYENYKLSRTTDIYTASHAHQAA
jgi:lipoyl(octanoyl) transferase